MEKWKPIKGYEDSYEISSYGNVRSKDREVLWGKNKALRRLKGQTMKIFNEGRGYKYVTLGKGNKKKNFLVHRLVAFEFCKKTEGKNYVNHIDFNRANNHMSNLEWVTQSENNLHSVNAGRIASGSACNFAKLTEEEVLKIYELKGTLSYVDIAKQFNVNPTTVRLIHNKQTWKQLLANQ